MAFVIVGEFKYKHYESDFIDGLKDNGILVFPFNIWDNSKLFNFFFKIEYYFSFIGLATLFVYLKLFFFLSKIPKSQKIKVFFWRPTLISPLILKSFNFNSSKKLIFISYNNDNPFSIKYKKSNNFHQKYLWKNFLRTIPFFDLTIVYRPSDINEYKNRGAKKILLFPPGYSDSLIHMWDEKSNYKYDIVFIGHFEKKRIEYLNSILNSQINLKIFGTGWENKEHLLPSYQCFPIVPIYGDFYFKTLNKSKISLCFLSELNNDVYTRRNFEIPACKSLMLSERTEELLCLFKESNEAFYFSDSDEMLEKIKYLLSNEDVLQKVTNRGYIKSINSGYSINSRVKKLLLEIDEA